MASGFTAPAWAADDIQKALATKVPSIELAPGALKDALDFISDRFNIRIDVDKEAFRRKGIKDVNTQTVKLKRLEKIELGKVLRALLQPVHGTFLLKEDRILVVPKPGEV
jgi:hypothetical protein